MIRAVIIDDEPLSIEALVLLLEKKCPGQVLVVATSTSPQLGKQLVEKHKPDLLFVDVEMPGMSGIDLVRSFDKPVFRVVFVTAYDAYAIQALRLSAIDYLLKPVEPDEIVRVVTKIREMMEKNENSLSEQLSVLEKSILKHSNMKDSRIGIAMAEKILFINVQDILYCIADGAYTHVYLQRDRKIVASKTLGEFEQQLMSHGFFRIHHSTIINLHRIKEFQRVNGGFVIMENDKKLEVSHRKRSDFLAAINDLVI